MTPEELMQRQRNYDELVMYFKRGNTDNAVREAFELHDRIVRILDGKEPDPRGADKDGVRRA